MDSSNTSTNFSNSTTEGENAPTNFEKILLQCCKQNVQAITYKKTRVATQAEIITNEEFRAKLAQPSPQKVPQKRGRKPKNKMPAEAVDDKETDPDDVEPIGSPAAKRKTCSTAKRKAHKSDEISDSESCSDVEFSSGIESSGDDENNMPGDFNDIMLKADIIIQLFTYA